jgi:hypothetical protein
MSGRLVDVVECRALLEALRDALAAGDVDEALAIVLDALEAAGARSVERMCPECGYQDFPGAVADHRRWVHRKDAA